MISLDQAARQMNGAVKMAFNRSDWRQSLDRDVDDVFSSAFAIALCIPLLALSTHATMRAADRIPDLAESLYAKAPFAALFISDLATFAIDWAASLVLLVLVARATGAGRQAADLIVGFNWIQPLIVAAQLPAIALMAASASQTLGALVFLPAFALTLTLLFGVVRRGLGAEPVPAAAVIIMLILVGVAVELVCSAAFKLLMAGQA